MNFMKLIDILWIGIGGFLGTIARYAAGLAFENKNIESHLPLSTFSVNIIGSFVLGLVIGLTYNTDFLKPHVKLALTVGFCGAFTTFI